MAKKIKDEEYSMFHTRLRLAERYGINMEHDEYIELCERFIKKDTINIIKKEPSNDQCIFSTVFKDRIVKLVWSYKKNCITTAII